MPKTPEELAAEKAAQDAANKETPKTVSVEEFEATKTELKKLQKIFDDRQTKALKKEDVLKKGDLLKALGLTADPEKEPTDLINEKLTGLSDSLADLTKQLETEKAEKELVKKQNKAIKAAEKFNFHDIDDVMKFVNLDAENLEDEFTQLIEKKPYLVKAKQDILGGNPPNAKNLPKDIDQQIADAIKKGDYALSIALKNKKAGITA